MIPQRPEELTAEWLTEAFRRNGRDVRVVSVDVESARDATNFNGIVRVESEGDPIPDRLFVKLPPIEPARRARLDWASMGRRECRFYRDLAPELDVRTPEIFAAELDDESGEFCIAMEAIGDGSAQLPDVVAGLAPEIVADGLASLAGLHARFESAEERTQLAPWLQPSGRTSTYGAQLLREGMDRDPGIAAQFVAVAERYIADRDLLQDAWELGPTTVLHGDVHIGNVFVDHGPVDHGRVDSGELGFFDWGLMVVGSPMRDVSYALTMLLSPQDRRAHEASLIRGYLDQREELGAAPLTFDDAWFSHRLQSAYGVVASCQSIGLPADTSAGRRAFADAFVNRATQAVDELGALEALAEFSRR